MKSIFGLLILLCLTFTASSQEHSCKVFYPQILLKEASNEDEILNYLYTSFKEEIGNSTLVLKAKTESPAAFHYFFQQAYLAIHIHQADIKVNISKQGKIVSVYSNLITSKQLSAPINFPSKDMDALFNNWLMDNKDLKETSTSYCFIATSSSLVPAVKITYKDKSEIAHEIIIEQTQNTQSRITSVFFAQDSMVTGKVFNPDPLTTANVSYGGAYQDFNDSDVVALNNQRQLKSFKTDFDGTTFRLKNQYVEIRDNNGDGILPATSTSPTFDFTRHQSGFEDVNTFYHIALHSDYIRTLGFNTSSQLVYPDPHAGFSDNSFFNEPNTLNFGTGGIDDAEDADVIIHEYTHFVSYNASPGSNVGPDRTSIDEGTCDYFAASYSKAISNYNWTKVFNWDGNPPFWNGRVVNTTKHYPENATNNIYNDATMWSATLMQIHNELGRATTDSIVLQTMYLFAPNMSYPQAAKALLTADTLITGGKNFCVLYRYLYQRGYIPLIANPCGISSIGNINTSPLHLLQTPNGFVIESEESSIYIKGFTIIDAIGNNIFKDNSAYFDKKQNFSTGLYFVQVESNSGNKTFKVLF